jgi:hypothetical protein
MTGGYGAGLTGAFYFDYGGYYYRKIYGIKAEVNYSRHSQTYQVFANEGPVSPDIFYKYKARLSFIDVPVMFNFCPTHHQGFTVECGPQVSFLQSANIRSGESTIINPDYPSIKKSDFRPVTFSAVLGGGCFYSFTERFALVATLRTGYTFTDLARSTEGINKFLPTTRFWAGAYIQAVYKINKYGSNKNRGYQYYLKRMKKK